MFNLFRRFAAQDAPPDSKATDSYFEKLLKYIPADIVAGYVAIAGILQEHNNEPFRFGCPHPYYSHHPGDGRAICDQ